MPVHSSTTSMPMSSHGSAAGSRSDSTLMERPMVDFAPRFIPVLLVVTLPGKRPWMVS